MVHTLATKHGTPGTRLFRKLRRRMFRSMRLHFYHRQIFQNDDQWTVFSSLPRILHNLLRWPNLSEVRSFRLINCLPCFGLPTLLKTLIDRRLERY